MTFFKYLALFFLAITVSACSGDSYMKSHDDENDNVNNNEKPFASTEDADTKVGDRVFFDFDSSAINADAAETLQKQAAFMEQNPELKFIIEGHCDERGTREYNLGLGERRANSAKQYLITLGVDAKRLTTVSYGKERPAVIGSDNWAWSQNRRSVTVAK